jgi:hypothetical protein
MKPEIPWAENFPGAITLCDRDGVILDMNERAAQGYQKDGGRGLIGRSLFPCHSERSQAMLKEMLASGQPNVYTIEKNGVKKLIYQTPWYQDGAYAGFAELSLEIPFEMPHFVRG